MTSKLNYSDRLKEIYYDVSHVGSLGNAQTLHKILKKEGYKVTLKDIQDWLKLQEVVQVTQQDKKPVIYAPITGPDGTWQADLMFLTQYKNLNDGFHIILVFIEVTSRKVFAYPMKKKNTENIIETYNEFLKQIDNKIVNLTTDEGSEFISKEFQNINTKHNIKHYLVEPGNHTKLGKVDRVIRSIRSKISKYQKAFKTLRYIDVFEKLISNYNNTIHSSTGYAPNEVNIKRANKIRKALEARKQIAIDYLHTFEVGQKCRVLKVKYMYQKGLQTYTKSIYTIVGIDNLHIRIKNDKNGVERNEKPYKLKLIDEIEKAPENEAIVKHSNKQNNKENKVINKMKREDAFKGNVDDFGKVSIPEKMQPMRERRVRKQYPVIGSRVTVKFDNEPYPGTVRKVTATGYKIDFDDGNEEDNKKVYKKNEVELLT